MSINGTFDMPHQLGCGGLILRVGGAEHAATKSVHGTRRRNSRYHSIDACRPPFSIPDPPVLEPTQLQLVCRCDGPDTRRCFSVVLMPALQIPSKHTCEASAIRHDFARVANDWRFAALGWILRDTGFHARTCPGIKRLNAERPANCARKYVRRTSFALSKNPSAP
jgi:hypothetical protein